ncbi:MAG: ATP-binding cassette domain-containing protein, partial [Propionibacteriaceae bacterium]|nr:ATP-binding cassette domain-containing protein [Propionibacteriaceae bacterium]
MITFDDVSKAFDGRPVLAHLSCQVPSGAVLRVEGPNGAGKSTLLKIVLGLVNPDSGVVDGVAGRRVAAVFQEDRLCPWLSAIGNLRLVVPSMTRPDAEAALASWGLPVEAMTRPVRQLSGGQRRRVAIARALVAPADIVCLDEPFTGIDAASLPDV